MKVLALVVALISSSAMADDYIHWKEPPVAPLSPTGTVLSVENWRCEVTSSRTFKCLNVGRVCVEQRRKTDEDTAKMFGCGLKDSPNYPCKDSAQRTEEEIRNEMSCAATVYGW